MNYGGMVVVPKGLRFWLGGRDDGWCWSVQIRALCHNEHALTKDNGNNVEVEEKEEH